ncbi:MAG: signal recognition particle receptor subunit alpha [Candidatus Methylarchaceae archaeon HK02M2]|nr:signal recognition particle receptor subunit alpha [Candidatus Methylarchaceae archaeon HK02M2]
MLERLKEGLQAAIKRILTATTIDKQLIKDFVKDTQRALLQADVNVKLVLELSSKIEKRALHESPPPGLSRKDHIIKILYDELVNILGTESKLDLSTKKVNIILLMGIQGSGKTLVAAKLARFLRKKGYKVGLICADTFRPGALVQLRTYAKDVGIEVFGDEEFKDSIKVVIEGLRNFRENKNVIIVDTAGRHKEEKSLLDEMRHISNKVKPTLTLLIIDSTIGQQSYAQSKAFHKAVNVGGIIVTKLDGAAKGGGALTAAATTGAKVLFIGTGERVDDLEAFSPTRFVGRLLGLGDIKALVERARDLEIEADEKKVQRIISGKMTIDDLYYQLEQVKKMGSLRKVLELIPGLSSSISSESLEELEEKMKTWKNIILSMTKAERENPEILNSSRIKRMARGSGTSEKAVKEMLSKYRQTKAIIKASKGRKMRQMLKRMALT